MAFSSMCAILCIIAAEKPSAHVFGEGTSLGCTSSGFAGRAGDAGGDAVPTARGVAVSLRASAANFAYARWESAAFIAGSGVRRMRSAHAASVSGRGIVSVDAGDAHAPGGTFPSFSGPRCFGSASAGTAPLLPHTHARFAPAPTAPARQSSSPRQTPSGGLFSEDTGAAWPCFTAAAEADQRRVGFRTDTVTHAPRGRTPSATRGSRAWCSRTRDTTPMRHARPIEAVETDISRRAQRSDVDVILSACSE